MGWCSGRVGLRGYACWCWPAGHGVGFATHSEASTTQCCRAASMQGMWVGLGLGVGECLDTFICGVGGSGGGGLIGKWCMRACMHVGQLRGNGVGGESVGGWAHGRVGGRVYACAQGEVGGQEGVFRGKGGAIVRVWFVRG